MTDLKKILSQVTRLIESSACDMTDPVVDAIAGDNFQTQIEREKNKNLINFLKENSHIERHMFELNEFISYSTRVFEKKLTLQNYKDLHQAITGILHSRKETSDAMQSLHSEIRMMISDTHSFVHSTLRLEDETSRMEQELSQLVSLPCECEKPFQTLEEVKAIMPDLAKAHELSVLKIYEQPQPALLPPSSVSEGEVVVELESPKVTMQLNEFVEIIEPNNPNDPQGWEPQPPTPCLTMEPVQENNQVKPQGRTFRLTC